MSLLSWQLRHYPINYFCSIVTFSHTVQVTTAIMFSVHLQYIKNALLEINVYLHMPVKILLYLWLWTMVAINNTWIVKEGICPYKLTCNIRTAVTLQKAATVALAFPEKPMRHQEKKQTNQPTLKHQTIDW